MSRLFHLLQSHDDSLPTGVPRFGRYFRAAFPDVFNITPGMADAVEWRDDDVCVVDNHLGMLVPDCVRVIVVHHGAAHLHFRRDPAWRTPATRALVYDQRRMFERPHTSFVAPSRWIAERFAEVAPKGYAPTIIPHAVGEIPTLAKKNPPVVLHDARSWNKGSGIIDQIAKACPEVEFRVLSFAGNDDAERARVYGEATAFLCLSLSEGASYSVADAEAASLKIVSTEVGNCYEFMRGMVPIKNRDDVEEVARAVRVAVDPNTTRGPSFYASFGFEEWKRRWEEVIRG